MTRRLSPSDLNRAYDRAKQAAEAAGIDTSRWVMQAGSTTYGRPYRLFKRDPQIGALSNPFDGALSDPLDGDGFLLGRTRKEAKASLDTMARAWRAVVYVRDQHTVGAR